MPFDPATRRETWCFLKVKRGKRTHFERLPFIFVQYDFEETRYLEPVPMSDFYYIDTHQFKLMDPGSTGARQVVGFEFFDAANQLYEGLHGF